MQRHEFVVNKIQLVEIKCLLEKISQCIAKWKHFKLYKKHVNIN